MGPNSARYREITLVIPASSNAAVEEWKKRAEKHLRTYLDELDEKVDAKKLVEVEHGNPSRIRASCFARKLSKEDLIARELDDMEEDRERHEEWLRAYNFGKLAQYHLELDRIRANHLDLIRRAHEAQLQLRQGEEA